MDPRWHIAFCNVTYTEYAGVTYHDYYGSPAVMLEAQLAAKEYAERRFGVGRFMHPAPEGPSCDFLSMLGMAVIEPEQDEIPYLDTRHPLVSDPDALEHVKMGDPRTTGLMAKRYERWQYYREQGYQVGFGGYGGAIISHACEMSAGQAMMWFYEKPEAMRRLLNLLMDAEEGLARFNAELTATTFTSFGYTGDDFSGLLSPAMYREFAVPCYQRLYGNSEHRFMHSELLRAEHLRIARDEVGITDFHGAGCKEVSLEDMYAIMGERFWTQLIPQEMLELSPAQIEERVKVLADSGCWRVQLYPGRGTPERNMEAAIAAANKYCPGGPV